MRGEERCEFEAFQSGHCSGTMEDVVRKIQKRIGLEPGYHLIPKCRSGLLKFQPKREDLPSRSMKDSFTTAILPLSSISKREHYVNHMGQVRVGSLMEELDMFAVWICHRHVKMPTLPKGIPLPYVFVTMLVDKIDFYNIHKVDANEDIELCGHVSWVGTSSLEISIYLRQQLRTITKAIFMMVARNATNTGKAAVNVLEPDNEEEQRCFDDAIKRQRRRRVKQSNPSLVKRPSESDEKLMFELYRRTNGTDIAKEELQEEPPNCSWMSKSFQTTMLHPFPDNRNAQNNIFGGFVMRNAVEISFITASVYSRSRPWIECILDIGFFRRIKVNSFLKMTSYVVYTHENYMQLLTVVQVMDANNFEEVTTNLLNLTYSVDRQVKEVLPSTYQETLWYIEGRKKFLDFQKLRALRETKIQQRKVGSECN
ncbi:hypothetical protein ACLKA7_003250 [Drosophila subpalustris]